ncbi:MAG: two-component system, OmpR family, sensor histidine kinase KdpD [Chloroflexota bacterium]|nr:two-component system, OmpR family, sensor histidine kinase KdpD [Chloroflexota bacterium]
MPNASSVFLLAVVVAGVRFGTTAAIGAALAAFLVYDALFIEPRLTLRVADPGEWLNLVLLLVVGIVVGRLAAGQRDRAEAALAREHEAVSLFRLSRVLATRSSTAQVLPELAAILQAETAMVRIRITLAVSGDLERTAVDTATSPSAAPGVDGSWTPPASHHALRRTPGDAPAEWVRVHQQIAAGSPRGRADADAYRVFIEVGDRRIGSIWAVRPRRDGPPDGSQTRLLSAGADQIGQALELDRLGREAREMEIARRSDALKTALLESVSHDLRTPLASIRAAAGTLLDRDVPLEPGAQASTAEAIDREAEHLNGLVTNLLDLSRIEAGELRTDPEPFELATLVGEVVGRLRVRLAGRVVEVDIPDDLPPVLVDGVFIDQVLTNILENTIKYTPPSARIRLHATAAIDPPADAVPTVALHVEDDGPGVPDDAIGRLFDRFFRVQRPAEPSRPGSGIGLTVVRGLVEAMGGRVAASRSVLGGLAIDLVLPSVAPLAGTGHRP